MRYFSFGSMVKKIFIPQVNMFYPTIKVTAENSKDERNFLDVNIR